MTCAPCLRRLVPARQILLSQRGNDRRSLLSEVDPRSQGCPSIPWPSTYLSCGQRAPGPDVYPPPPRRRPAPTPRTARPPRGEQLESSRIPLFLSSECSALGWMRSSTRNKFFWQCLRDICQLVSGVAGEFSFFFVNISVNL